MAIDINFMVGGEAGQGVQSVGFLLAKAFARGGYHIFADQDYESRIRGGHNFFRVRVKEGRVGAIADPVDMLIALNKETIDLHQKELASGGVVIYDGQKIKAAGDGLFSVPLEKLAQEKAGDKLMTNTVALGAALGMVRYDFTIVDKLLREFFKTPEIGESNVKAARAGYEYAQSEFKGEFAHRISPLGDARRMLLNGNEAVALGALAAGCKFMASYPMTPSTPILEYMASKQSDLDLVVVQPEDEISAINMAVGAGYAGVRAMTATSGSGFCLMVEGLGLAGITETPVVIVNGQRPGPAVGLPTRTEQGDLLFALHAHQGDFPRALLAPANVEDAFWLTVKAFNLAEKYQLPVIILTDHYLVSSYETVDKFDLSKITIERGQLYTDGTGDPTEYKRHRITDTGISPRAFPGLSKALVMTDADEHDEEGHLIEDAGMRTQQMQKRLRKVFSMKKEISAPWLYGPQKADTLLIGWGSSHGAIHEAVDMLRKEGADINFLHLNELWPFPAEAVADALGKANKSYVIESNATGQLAWLIRAETGREVTGKILRFDGRPLTPRYIAQEMIKEGCGHGNRC
ncbi:MAG: 2-oxoacid:acceptor oxidoreductase subunit alpha [Chloroflexi bacterium]|nr:2-oxoacid:acceptor oxidoreductase subunit alpha [Chloroflexota bacterium]